MIKFVSRLNLTGSRVDRENGVIKGVSLISLGEAKGHDKLCDRKTLETVRDCAKEYGDGLKVKFNPETFTHGPAGMVGRIPIDTIRVKGDKTIGDLHLYKSYNEKAKEYLYEMAEETPGNIGLSIEFTGDDEEIKGEKFARCSEIYAATIVDLPAANPTGLFSEGDFNKFQGDQSFLDWLKSKISGGLDGLPDELKYPIQTLLEYQENEAKLGNAFSKQKLTSSKDKTKSKTETEELIMDKETITQLTGAFTEALKPVKESIEKLTQRFEEAPPAKSKEDQEKEEMAAAGVTDKDDEATKTQKLSDYRASMAAIPNKKISEMSGKEFAQVVSGATSRGNMQFFRSVGGKPAKVSPEGDDDRKKGDDFEKLVQEYQQKPGIKNRAMAITRARQDHPAAYNTYRAKQNPGVQTMEKK